MKKFGGKFAGKKVRGWKSSRVKKFAGKKVRGVKKFAGTVKVRVD